MIFLWLAMMLFLCAVGVMFYLFIKRPTLTFGNFGKMGGYISTQFSRVKQAEIFQSFKSLKNKQFTLQKCAVLQGEEKEIFMLLRQGLPLGQVCILPHVSLRLFVESDDCPELEYCVSFLIAGNKSLLPLVAVDYLDELDEGARVLCASKKLLLQQANVPYLLLVRQKFLKDDSFEPAQLREWLITHLFSKFKTAKSTTSD